MAARRAPRMVPCPGIDAAGNPCGATRYDDRPCHRCRIGTQILDEFAESAYRAREEFAANHQVKFRGRDLARYCESIHSVAIRTEGLHGGVWDHDEEPEMPPKPRKGPRDAEAIRLLITDPSPLTEAERDVAARVLRGDSRETIAAARRCTVETVKDLMRRVRQRMRRLSVD